jgi:hypothetical protein
MDNDNDNKAVWWRVSLCSAKSLAILEDVDSDLAVGGLERSIEARWNGFALLARDGMARATSEEYSTSATSTHDS